MFNWLLKKIPYVLAVVIPNIFWAFFAAAFGFSLIFLQADFEITGTGEIFIRALLLSVITVASLVFLEAGFLRFFGIKGVEGKEIRIVNDNILNGHVRSDISKKTLLEVYKSLEKTHRKLFHRNIEYTSIVVATCTLVEFFASGQLTNIPVILTGGLIGVAVSFICTIPLYELLFSSVRRECKILLAKGHVQFKEPHFLSLRVKSRFFIVLTFLAFGIVLLFVSSIDLALLTFFILTLIIVTVLSKLVFESIYKAFMEIEESAKKLEEGGGALFFSGSFDEEIISLSKNLNIAANEIYYARSTLEIQVKARTRALEEEKKNLEERIKGRTKELQERVEELERFNKITVRRELKMIELKEEIKKLRVKDKTNQKK